MFNLRTGEVLPHDKKYFTTHMLPIEFDPENVPDCPSWKERLREWNPADAVIRELQKFFGYCLTRETRYEKMLLLYGPGGDGKSTVMKILRALVGEQNCSHIPMGRLEDQFYLSRLVDKLVNMSTEVESRAMQSQEIKAIVSGDPISASFKNQTPFDFEPFCKLVYSTNRLPKMLDNSDGFFRKIMIIEFKGQFVKRKRANIFLYDELIQELPGIFAWALAGLVMLRDEGFSEVAEMQSSLQDYKRMNNNILYYIEKHVEADPRGKAGKDALYEDYVKRCRSWNLLPIGEPQFRREFNRLLDEKCIDVRDGKLPRDEMSGRRPNAYAGIRLVEEKCHGEEPDAFPPPPSPSAGGAS
jgi:putative DNA primase/helicase